MKLRAGQRLVAGMFALGFLGAAVSWWYYQQLQRRPLELWGTDSAALMMRAPRATALKLAPAGDEPPDNGPSTGESLAFDGQRWTISERRDVSQARGFSHIRHSLVHGRSFAWDDPPDDRHPQWTYGLEFTEGDRTATLLFDFDLGQAILLERGARVSIQPIVAGLDPFFREQFARPPQAEEG